MKKILLALLAALAFAVPGFSQGVDHADLLINYNLDATTFTYCVAQGANNSPFGGSIAGVGNIQTTGSNTSVTETTVGSLPFTLLSGKDTIFVTRPDGTTDTRTIATRTDASNIVLDTAVNWTGGFAFRWKKTVCGGTANDGWVDVAGKVYKTLTVEYNQGDLLGGLDVSFECKSSNPTGTPVTVYPRKNDTCDQGTQTIPQQCNFTTAGIGKANRFSFDLTSSWQACRIGIKAGTSDPSDAGTNAERINAYFDGRAVE